MDAAGLIAVAAGVIALKEGLCKDIGLNALESGLNPVAQLKYTVATLCAQPLNVHGFRESSCLLAAGC